MLSILRDSFFLGLFRGSHRTTRIFCTYTYPNEESNHVSVFQAVLFDDMTYLQATNCANMECKEPLTPLIVADKSAKTAIIPVEDNMPNFRPTLSLTQPAKSASALCRRY
jgi:hypothetical protein